MAIDSSGGRVIADFPLLTLPVQPNGLTTGRKFSGPQEGPVTRVSSVQEA